MISREEFLLRFRGRFLAYIMDCWALKNKAELTNLTADRLVRDLDNALDSIYTVFVPPPEKQPIVETPVSAPVVAQANRPALAPSGAAPVRTPAIAPKPMPNGLPRNNYN